MGDNDDKGFSAEKEFRKAAANQKRRFLFSIAGSSEPMDQRLMDYVSVEPEDLPTVRILTDPMATMTKYRMDTGEVSGASISQFVKDFETGRLTPHLKSEEPPTTQIGPVFTLVG